MNADLRREFVAIKSQVSVKEPPAFEGSIREEEVRLADLQDQCETKAHQIANLTSHLSALKQELSASKFEAHRSKDLAEDLRIKSQALAQTESELTALAEGLSARERLIADRMGDLDKN